jgi:uncharacterized protein (TIGR03067 family)
MQVAAMRKTCTSLALVVILVGPLALPWTPVTAADDETPQQERAALQGRWECHGVIAFGPGYAQGEAFLYGGRKVEPRVGLKVMALEVKGNNFTFAGTAAGKATAMLDPSKSPKAIDLTDAKGRTWLGVYDLKNDTFTINLSLGKTRPTKVTYEANGTFGQVNAFYKRAKKR